MKEQKKVNLLATESEGKLIAKFAIPAIISMLVSSLYNIVDQIFIGQGVGLLGNAATNIAFPVSIICTATALLLGIGSASNFNLCSGAGDHEKASRIAGTGLSMLVICGVIIAAVVLVFLDPLLHLFGVTAKILPYAQDYTGITAFGIPFLILTTGGNHLIRADRSPTYSMTCMLTGAIINTVLDPLFIFGFHWGIKGAAWATVIGQIVSGIMVIVYFGRFRKMELKKEMFRPRGHLLKMILSLGMASCINQIAMAVVQITMNNTLRYYGAASVYGTDIPLACVGVISKVNMVFMAIAIGISQGCQPIWGYNYGAGEYDRVKKITHTSMGLIALVMVMGMAISCAIPQQLMGLFTTSRATMEIGGAALRIISFGFVVSSVSVTFSGVLEGLGKGMPSLLISLARYIVVMLPVSFALSRLLQASGVWYGFAVTEYIVAVLSYYIYKFHMRDIKG